MSEQLKIATKETWRTFITEKEADTLQINGADDFAGILALRERLQNSLAGSISDEAFDIFNKLGMPLAGGWSEEEGNPMMGGFVGKCKCSCFGCNIAWVDYPDDQYAGCCPECGKDASLIQAIRDEWIPIEKCIQPYKTFLVASAQDLFPVPAFYLIDNTGEKVWLRESEGPGDSEEMWDKARRNSELLRPPTHFMEVPEMPIDEE